jgi:FtsH-binding integral membrane protein
MTMTTGTGTGTGTVRPVQRVDTQSAAFAGWLTQSFVWMFLALLLTGVVGWFTLNTPEVIDKLSSAYLLVVIVQFVIGIGLAVAITKISATLATLLFFVYAATMGVTIGLIIYWAGYSTTTVVSAAAAAGGMFGGAAIYGLVTKRNLATMAGFLVMALIGIIVASIVNIFIGWETLNFIISVVGVLIFTGLTAYTVQQIATGRLAAWLGPDKGAIYGAFQLYLNAINLFMFILRIFGGSR